MSLAGFCGRFFLSVVTVSLLGCAVGNQYRYQAANVGLPLEKHHEGVTIGLGVKDSRIYVLNGNKSENFVGLQRGGFGNPFNVTTASNLPFAEDVTGILVGMLEPYGYKVEFESSSADLNAFTRAFKARDLSRAVYLNIREWKTDIYTSITLHYDLELIILDGEGTVLARSNQSGSESIGGYTMSGNDVKASNALATKLSYLFINPEVQAALK
jgi:hypothetical protein